MVVIAKSRGLESQVADFLDIPFESKTFDSVWAYTSLLHVSKKDLPKALQEVRRVLKDDGTFGLGMIEGSFEGYKDSKGVADTRLFSFYTLLELGEILKKNGFEVIYFETFIPKNKNYLNFILKKVRNFARE